MQVRRRISVGASRPLATFGFVGAAALIVDQVSKMLVRAWFEPSVSLPVIEGIFHITYVRNTGAAFGLLPGARPLFILVAALVLIGIVVYWRIVKPRALWLVTALALVGGGASGNLIDRLSAGRVTDFFDFTLIGWPVFNFADVAIVLGAVMLVIWILLDPQAQHTCSAPIDCERGRGETEPGT